DNDTSFPEFLNSVCLEKNIDKKVLLNEADLSRSYYYEIINGNKTPNRDTVLKICFVLSLSREETDKALKLTFNGALYPKNTRDATIIFCLNKGYTLLQTDYILYDNNLKTLTKE
ncbi:MAG: helix-turn-helix domain-containing protein, partial [Clostridium sp.]